ncbi:hypothetical protein DPMN_047155 [Dreissena polymorpha]|uniref:Uncharacterized protein n=1 Tax=Dreissena polymorpha TaxID=45954 RepID=A0A9D4D9B1_DREPO|nr:hypothetical protein DPMN_047155 [Dreissena polymorpha]
MNRNIIQEEVAKRHRIEKLWMKFAEVDARSFLYYLQYLKYGGLGERDNQLHVLGVFESYIFDIRNKINLYHPDTAMKWKETMKGRYITMSNRCFSAVQTMPLTGTSGVFCGLSTVKNTR